MQIARLLFSRRWWWTTLTVIAAVYVLSRFGFWQLDRLAERRAFNARVTAQWEAAPLNLNSDTPEDPLTDMEYRAVIVRGEYDFENERVIKNQNRQSRLGYALLTPLKIDGTPQVVLINRGWVPADEYTLGAGGTYAERGIIEISGMIRLAKSEPDFGGLTDPTPMPGITKFDWFMVNIPEINKQLPYEMLPIYIQQGPADSTPEGADYPIRTQPEIELTEGSHLGYAIQWFSFAVILLLGYPVFLRRESLEEKDA